MNPEALRGLLRDPGNFTWSINFMQSFSFNVVLENFYVIPEIVRGLLRDPRILTWSMNFYTVLEFLCGPFLPKKFEYTFMRDQRDIFLSKRTPFYNKFSLPS